MKKERFYITGVDKECFFNNTTLLIKTDLDEEYRFTFTNIDDVKKIFYAIRDWGEWTDEKHEEWEEYEYERWELD